MGIVSLSWKDYSYGMLLRICEDQLLIKNPQPILHPDAKTPYDFIINHVNTYSSYPPVLALKQRFSDIGDYHYLPGFTQDQIFDQLRNEKVRNDVSETVHTLQQKLINKDTKPSDFIGVVELLNTNLYSTSEEQVYRLSDWREYVNYFLTSPDIKVCNYGIPSLDKYTDGIRPGDFVVIYANTTQGKSTLSRYIAGNAASQGKTVVYFTLEEEGRKSVLKTFSTLYRTNFKKIIRKTIEPNEWHRMAYQIDRPEGDVIFADRLESKSIGELVKYLNRYKPDLFILDQIPLFTPNGDPDWQVVTKVSRQLKDFAQYHKVPMIALTQATRKIKKNVSIEDSMGFAYAQGQDADVVIFLHPDEPGPGYTRKRITLLKNRDGEKGMNVDLIWRIGEGIIQEEAASVISEQDTKKSVEFRAF